MLTRAMPNASIAASLSGGWRLLREDPVGVLLPAGAVLLLQAGCIAAAQQIWPHVGFWGWIGLCLVLSVGRVVLSAPLRAAALAAGARQLDHGFSSLRRAPSLAVVWLVAALAEGLLVGVLLYATLAPAWWLLARGTYWGAILLAGTTTPVILLIGLLVRALFAYAPVCATAGGLGPVDALLEGLRDLGRDWMGVLIILILGETLVALGSLLCGAGALPGTAFSDLALLHRWAARAEAP